MRIYVEELRFKCIIGILDFERVQKQEVIINLTIDYTYEKEFIDYAKVVTLIKKTMKKRKFLLIEDALASLTKKLKKNFPHSDAIWLKITKPSILADCKVSVAKTTHFNS